MSRRNTNEDSVQIIENSSCLIIFNLLIFFFFYLWDLEHLTRWRHC